jgi:hypothetical protein
MVHSSFADPEVDHVLGQQEVSLTVEGSPRTRGIKTTRSMASSIIGRHKQMAGIDSTVGVVGTIVGGWNGGTSIRKPLHARTGRAIVRKLWVSVNGRSIRHQNIVNEGIVVVRKRYIMRRMAGTAERRGSRLHTRACIAGGVVGGDVPGQVRIEHIRVRADRTGELVDRRGEHGVNGG